MCFAPFYVPDSGSQVDFTVVEKTGTECRSVADIGKMLRKFA